MLTTPQGQPPPDTAHTTWFLGDGCPYPLIFIFSLLWAQKKHQYINLYIADLHEWLSKAFKEVQSQSTSEAERQRWYYDCKANTISLEPGDLVLAKANPYKGRRKMKDQWEEEPYEVECRIAEGTPSYLLKNQWAGCSQVLHWNHPLLITPIMGAPLCSGYGLGRQGALPPSWRSLLRKQVRMREHHKVPAASLVLDRWLL